MEEYASFFMMCFVGMGIAYIVIGAMADHPRYKRHTRKINSLEATIQNLEFDIEEELHLKEKEKRQKIKEYIENCSRKANSDH